MGQAVYTVEHGGDLVDHQVEGVPEADVVASIDEVGRGEPQPPSELGRRFS